VFKFDYFPDSRNDFPATRFREFLAGLVTVDTLSSSKILPSPLDPEVHAAVAEATAMAAISEGLARIKVESDAVRVGTLERVQLLRRRQSSLS
jgi:malic enzyme